MAELIDSPSEESQCEETQRGKVGKAEGVAGHKGVAFRKAGLPEDEGCDQKERNEEWSEKSSTVVSVLRGEGEGEDEESEGAAGQRGSRGKDRLTRA